MKLGSQYKHRYSDNFATYGFQYSKLLLMQDHKNKVDSSKFTVVLPSILTMSFVVNPNGHGTYTTCGRSIVRSIVQVSASATNMAHYRLFSLPLTWNKESDSPNTRAVSTIRLNCAHN